MISILEGLEIPISAKHIWALLLIIMVYIFVIVLVLQKVNKKITAFFSVVGTLIIIAIWSWVVILKHLL